MRGGLDQALRRLGTPREAAEAFASAPKHPPPTHLRRVAAYVVDVAVSLGPAIIGPSLTGGSLAGWWFWIFLVGLAWYAIGLTLTEWRWGTTPGKAALGLRVISTGGTAISLRQAVLRRIPLVFSGGVLQLIDWAFAFFGPVRQRGFERIADTRVVDERRGEPDHASRIGEPLPPDHARSRSLD